MYHRTLTQNNLQGSGDQHSQFWQICPPFIQFEDQSQQIYYKAKLSSFQNIMIWQGFQIWTIFIMQHSDRIVSYCTLTSSHVVVIVSYSHCCRCTSKNPNPIKNVANSRVYYYHLSGINRRINVLKLCDKHAGQLQWTSKTSDRVCWFGL